MFQSSKILVLFDSTNRDFEIKKNMNGDPYNLDSQTPIVSESKFADLEEARIFARTLVTTPEVLKVKIFQVTLNELGQVLASKELTF